jgi:hypothetical protein
MLAADDHINVRTEGIFADTNDGTGSSTMQMQCSAFTLVIVLSIGACVTAVDAEYRV